MGPAKLQKKRLACPCTSLGRPRNPVSPPMSEASFRRKRNPSPPSSTRRNSSGPTRLALGQFCIDGKRKTEQIDGGTDNAKAKATIRCYRIKFRGLLADSHLAGVSQGSAKNARISWRVKKIAAAFPYIPRINREAGLRGALPPELDAPHRFLRPASTRAVVLCDLLCQLADSSALRLTLPTVCESRRQSPFSFSRAGVKV